MNNYGGQMPQKGIWYLHRSYLVSYNIMGIMGVSAIIGAFV